MKLSTLKNKMGALISIVAGATSHRTVLANHGRESRSVRRCEKARLNRARQFLIEIIFSSASLDVGEFRADNIVCPHERERHSAIAETRREWNATSPQTKVKVRS